MRALVVALTCTMSVPALAESDPVAEVESLAQARETAVGTGDAETWLKQTADNYVGVNVGRGAINRAGSGKIAPSKQRLAAEFSSGNRSAANPRPAKITDQKFLVQDENHVFETGHRVGQGNSYRYVRAWVKQDGAWLVVSNYKSDFGPGWGRTE